MKSATRSMPIQDVAIPRQPFEPFKSSDVVLLFKTGHSVMQQRVPVHFENELKQLPYPIQLYSDHESSFHGRQVIDILRDAPDRVRTQADFQPYYALKSLVAQNKPVDQLEGGWKLDKYKFIPILRDAWDRFPTAKWFINFEADSYMMLDNLVRWLANLDPNAQEFLGSPVQIIDAGWWFAHGGSGYVLSRGLMQQTFQFHSQHVNHVMDDFQANACCGDEILARALFSTPDVYLKAPNTASHNIFLGETPTSMRLRENNWCQPVMSFHHVTPTQVEQIHQFEKQMTPRLLPTDYIRRLDVFEAFAPEALLQAYADQEMFASLEGWENRSEDTEVLPFPGQAFDATFCEKACAARTDCWQWQFRNNDEGPQCILANNLIRIGGKREGFTSGWIVGRLRAMRKEQACENRRFVDS